MVCRRLASGALSLYRLRAEVNLARLGKLRLALIAEELVGSFLGLGLALVQAGADRGEQVFTRLADVGVGVEQAALEDIRTVTQHAGALAYLGTALGLACHLGEWISRGGELMEKPIGKLLGERNGDDEDGLPREEYLSLLVTAIVLFCSSGTGIYGCLDAGMTGNATVLLSKSILDFFTAMVFACNLGAVTSLVAVPQAAVFFALFFAAKAIYPLTTPTMIGDFKACGGFLLIATGCRIAKIQDFPVADMIPAMVLVMPLSALWTNYIAPLL